MTSKIVVNNIEADAGVSTVTFNSNVVRGSSNLHSTGLALGAGSTVGAVTGVTTYYGDGSQLTGITAGTSLSGSTNNTVCTVTGANAIQGESNVQIDSNGRLLIGTTTEGSIESDDLTIATTGHTGITLRSGTTHEGNIFFSDGTSGADEYRGLIRYDHDGDKMIFGTGDGSERMRISSTGIVTKPNQPSFHAVRTAGDVSGNNYVVFNRVDHNNGSHYDNSNGRFTAPVTGVYFFSCYHFTGSTSAIRLNINGSQFGAYHWDDTGGCATWIAPMTAGQYAQIYTVSYTFRGTSDYHNGFNGFLIG